MANSILTSNITVPFTAEIEANLVVLANGRLDISKEFKPGTGSSVDVLIPGYGNAAVGADLTGRLSDVKNASVTVALKQYSDGVTLDQLEQTLDVQSFEDQLAQPYGAKFSSDIQKLAVEELWLNAGTAIAAATAGDAKYTDIAKGISAITAARSFGQKVIAVDPDTASLIQNSGLNFFQADLKPSFLTGKLGTFRGAQCFETPDMNHTLLTIGAQAIAATCVFTYVEGAGTIALATGTNSGTIKKGQVLYAAGVNMTTIYGEDSGKKLAIIALEDKAFAADAITDLKIKPIYWTAGHPLRNATATVNGKVVTSAHAQNKVYKSVLIWDKQAFVTASAKLKGLSQTEKKGALGKVMNTLFQVGSDTTKGFDIFRWDVLIGFKILRDMWVSRVDIDVTP